MWVIIGKIFCYGCNFVILIELIEEDRKKGTNGAGYGWWQGCQKLWRENGIFLVPRDRKRGGGMKKKTRVNNQNTQTRRPH